MRHGLHLVGLVPDDYQPVALVLVTDGLRILGVDVLKSNLALVDEASSEQLYAHGEGLFAIDQKVGVLGQGEGCTTVDFDGEHFGIFTDDGLSIMPGIGPLDNDLCEFVGYVVVAPVAGIMPFGSVAWRSTDPGGSRLCEKGSSADQ